MAPVLKDMPRAQAVLQMGILSEGETFNTKELRASGFTTNHIDMRKFHKNAEQMIAEKAHL
jgi:hypothetical protein